jgi:tRNA(Ile)-lysidine synthase
LLRALESAVRRLGLPGRGVLVAVSGGVDSTVLLHGLASLPQRLGLRLAAGHVNHGLRAAESDADEALAGELAGRLGVAFRACRVRPERLREGASSRARPTLQEACRRLRYDALAAQAAELGLERLATAHTADDQAETVLLRLLRGSAGDGLAGIPERSSDGRVVRPLLAATRAEILDYAGRHGLAWREDPSNHSEVYARSRLRTRWLPGLARDFNPGLLRSLGRLAEAQRRDAEWMESLVEREAQERFRVEADTIWIEPAGWSELPEALAYRLARWALRRAGIARDVSNIQLSRVVRFLGGAVPGRAIELPGHLVLAREPSGFRLGARGVRPGAPC